MEENNNLIDKIEATEIKDSRGNPTINVTVYSGKNSASFMVPSGASTGIHEAHELRDDDKRGVNNAIANVNNVISSVLLGKDVLKQRVIDNLMITKDDTQNKTYLGGNAMLGVSIAVSKLAAKVLNKETFQYLKTIAQIRPSREVPYLYMNLINGGKHANNNLAFQEYLIVPITTDPVEAVNLGIQVQNLLKDIITSDIGADSLVLGDEGGFAIKTTDIRKPLELLTRVIRENKLENKVRLALDVAANSFYSNGNYQIGGKILSKEELLNMYNSLISEFNIFSIEDPFQEEDFVSFQKLKEQNPKLFIIGDDLTVTNKILVDKAVKYKSINCMIIKPNQIGTLSETLDTMKFARDHDIGLIVSHRSGETDDDFIADLSYSFGCFGMKAGSPLKAERMIKYNRLIEILKKK